jgi:hypothetical protein
MFLSLFLSISIFASQNHQCLEKALDESCKEFEKLPDYIQLPDGTGYPNPKKSSTKQSGEESYKKESKEYKPSKEYEPATSKEDSGYGLQLNPEQMQKFVVNQAKVLRILNTLPTSQQVSEEFKVSFASNFAFLSGSAEGEIFIYWPPKGQGKVQKIPTAEFKKYVSSLPEIQKKQILELQNEINEGLKRQQEEFRFAAMSKLAREIEIMKEQKNKLSQRNSRINELFKFSQNEIIKTITKGRSYNQLSPEELSLVKKVETIKLKPTEIPDPPDYQGCKGGPNASYFTEKHEIYICGSYMSYPDTNIISAIGHEIGHSIDPCNCSNPLHRVINPIPSSDNTNSENQKLLSETMQRLGSAKEYTNLNFELFSNNEAKEHLIKKNYIEEVSKGIPFEKHPAFETNKCLVKEFGLREIASTDVEAGVMQFIHEYELLTGKKVDQEKIDEFKKKLLEQKNCSFGLTHKSQMNEVISDVYGAVVQQEYIKQNPSHSNKLSQFAFFWGEICKKSPENQNQNNSLADILSAREVVFKEGQKPHPENRKRVIAVNMQMPEVRKQFNCPLEGRSKCIDLMLNPKSADKASSDSKKASK